MSTVTNSLNKVFFRQSATPEYTIASQEAGVVYYGSIVDGGLLIDDSGDGTPIAGPFQTLTPYEDGQRVAFVLRGARPLILSIEGGFTATNQWSGLESITESTAEHSAEVEKALGEAKAALDEEMENLDERLEASRADFTQALESAATVAANLRTAIDLGLMRTGKASSPPEVGKGLTWAVLDEDTGTKVSGLRIANAAGTAWTPYQLISEDLMVVGAGGTVRLKNGVVDADVILANDALYKKLATSEFWATLATVENLVVTSKMLGSEIEGKVFTGGMIRGAYVEANSLTIGPGINYAYDQSLFGYDFASSVAGWSFGLAATGQSIARVTSPVHGSVGSMRVIGPTSGANWELFSPLFSAVSAEPGDYAAIWVQPTQVGTVRFESLIGDNHFSGATEVLEPNVWTKISVPLQPQDSYVGFRIYGLGGLGTLYVGGVQIMRPQTSIGAARFTISEGGAALLTAGGKSIVVEDLIDAALLGPNEIRIGGTVYERSGTLASIPQTPAFTQFGSTYARTMNVVLPFTPPAGWTFRWFTRSSSGYTTVERGGTGTQIRVIQIGSNDVNALAAVGWELVKV